MIIRVTHKTMIKKMYRSKDETNKRCAIYKVVTWWFCFIPVYSSGNFFRLRVNHG